MNEDKLTYDDLKSIFTSGYWVIEWEALDELWEALLEGIVVHSKKEIMSITEYNQLIDISEVDTEIPEGVGGDNPTHRVLKRIAKGWLEKQNFEVFVEKSFDGGFPDVSSKNHSFIIECGDTNPQRILTYLENFEVQKIGVLPYLTEDTSSLQLHIFHRGPKFKAYLTEKHRKLKEAHKKFHRRWEKEK